MKYAVEPLLTAMVRWAIFLSLKLIYRLGVINRQEYEDAELLMALREELTQTATRRFYRRRNTWTLW
ncbi:MltR family transcriptional regulator [Shigella sonnei]